MFGGITLPLSLHVLFLFVGLVCWFFEWTCLLGRFVFFNHLALVIYVFWFGCLGRLVLGWTCLLSRLFWFIHFALVIEFVCCWLGCLVCLVVV